MNVATIRNFTRNPYSYLNELPLRVTRHNETAFYVVATLGNVVTNNVATSKKVVTPNVPKTVMYPLKVKNVLTEKPETSFSPVPKPEFKGKKARIGYDKKKKKGDEKK